MASQQDISAKNQDPHALFANTRHQTNPSPVYTHEQPSQSSNNFMQQPPVMNDNTYTNDLLVALNTTFQLIWLKVNVGNQTWYKEGHSARNQIVGNPNGNVGSWSSRKGLHKQSKGQGFELFQERVMSAKKKESMILINADEYDFLNADDVKQDGEIHANCILMAKL
ncbi:hypothetical protein Tco_1181891 [Tanacetum coccineum]